MAIKIDISSFEKLLQIQKERQLAMKEASEALGIDIGFSDDEVMKFALEEYQKEIDKQINKEVSLLMKSLFS